MVEAAVFEAVFVTRIKTKKVKKEKCVLKKKPPLLLLLLLQYPRALFTATAVRVIYRVWKKNYVPLLRHEDTNIHTLSRTRTETRTYANTSRRGGPAGSGSETIIMPRSVEFSSSEFRRFGWSTQFIFAIVIIVFLWHFSLTRKQKSRNKLIYSKLIFIMIVWLHFIMKMSFLSTQGSTALVLRDSRNSPP